MGQRLSRRRNQERHAKALGEARQTARSLEQSHEMKESANQQSGRMQTERNKIRGDYTKRSGRMQTDHNTEHENATEPTEVASGGKNTCRVLNKCRVLCKNTNFLIGFHLSAELKSYIYCYKMTRSQTV